MCGCAVLETTPTPWAENSKPDVGKTSSVAVKVSLFTAYLGVEQHNAAVVHHGPVEAEDGRPEGAFIGKVRVAAAAAGCVSRYAP